MSFCSASSLTGSVSAGAPFVATVAKTGLTFLAVVAAIVVYANRALPSDRIDVAFATIFPSMTILKIVCVQVAIGVLGG